MAASTPESGKKPSPSPVLLCACSGAGWIEEEKLSALHSALTADGREVEFVPDLCRIAAQDPERLRDKCSAGNEPTIVACYPRAVHGLLARAGVAEPETSVHVIDLRTGTAAAALEALSTAPAENQRDPDLPVDDSADDWTPWYPVIDPERCVDCKQCMNFCLFGVYGEDEEGHIAVTHPDACKTNCPACARICPEAAIMFPKYPHEPINGAEVGELSSE